jgi:tripartite ATP-independent transporter DctP family solute receptor
MYRKALVILISVILLVIGFSGSIFAEDNPIIIKLSHALPEDTPQHVGALAFKKMVEERTDGAIEVQVFPASQIGSDVEAVEMMQSGAIQASLVPTAKMSVFDPSLQLIDLPFLFPNREITHKFLDSEIADDLFKPLENIGLKGLAFWESGFKQITANKEIRKPEDFKGLKFRVMESPLLIEQYKTLGANPVPIDFAEVYNALQQGVVDGQENPLVSITTMRFYEVQSYMMMTNHGYLAYAFLFSKAFWDKLSPEHQEIISKAALEAAQLERQEVANREEGYIKIIGDSGTIIVRFTEEELKAFANAMKPVHEKFADLIGRDLLQKAYNMLEKLKK